MKKVIGIYVYYLGSNEPHWDETSSNLGGSETWAIKISEEFQKAGYHVIVFGNPNIWHFSDCGVEYVPKEYLEFRCEYQHFDYFISSRTAAELSPKISCDNFYIMSHEARINLANSYSDLKMNLVKRIGYLSEWHKQSLMWQYNGLSDSDFVKCSNGVDINLYDDVDITKKRNMMVWSSCKERGLKYFIDAIFPCVKRMVPDFELVICAYNNDIPESYKTLDGITILGKLDKIQLSNLQKEAKIWAYLNYGDDEDTGYRCHETFCISAVENALAKNAIVCSNATGLETTLSGYSGFIGTGIDLSFENVTLEKINDLKDLAIKSMIDILYDDELRNSLAEEAYDICRKYTWENAAKEWISEFNNR